MALMKNLFSCVLASAVSFTALASGELPRSKWLNLRTPPFQILKSNVSGVEIAIGEMPLPKSATGLAVGANPYSYSVTAPSGKVGVREAILGSDLKISLAPGALPETGAYNVAVNCISGELDGDDNIASPELYECWSQDVFIYSAASRSKIGALRFDQVAAAYAPVLEFAPQEQYFPASLAYIFNKIESNNQLARHKFVIRDVSWDSCCGFNETVKFDDAFNLAKTQGNKNYMLDMGYEGSLRIGGPSEMSVRFGEGKSRPEEKAKVVIYYSVIPSRTNSSIFYLNYHTLYAYDAKGGDPAGNSGSTGAAGHAFDRESVTLKMQVSGASVTPLSVIFGQHLADQTMAMLDESENVRFTWLGGGVEIPWEQAIKEGNHPMVAIARGSHAVFPKPGLYGVLFGGVPLLKEQAGGGETLQPQNYELRDLGIMDFSPSSDTSVLSFSGYWVTIFFGKPDAKFPPFTNRETDPDGYATQAAKPGRSSGVPALLSW